VESVHVVLVGFSLAGCTSIQIAMTLGYEYHLFATAMTLGYELLLVADVVLLNIFNCLQLLLE
jgi:hypothetical protein